MCQQHAHAGLESQAGWQVTGEVFNMAAASGEVPDT